MVLFTFTISGSAPASPPGSPGALAGDTALRDWALSSVDGDLEISPADGDSVWVTGAAGVASDQQSRVSTWLGEWFWDTSLGFDYDEVLGKSLGEAKFRRALEAVAGAAPGTVSVTVSSVTFDRNARSLAAQYESVCDTGEVITASVQAGG